MTFASLFRNLGDLARAGDFGGVSNAGLFNIETGFAAARTTWLRACAACGPEQSVGPQQGCSLCGRTETNALILQSGDGDGLYTVVTLVNQKGMTIASVTLFDDSSELAQQFIAAVQEGNILQLDTVAQLMAHDYPCVSVGKLTGTDTVIYSDAATGIDGDMASLTVTDWVPGGIAAFMCVEPSIESPTAEVAIALGSSPEDFHGGFEGSLRPRALVLISDAYSVLSTELADFDLPAGYWARQFESWNRQLVNGHVSDQTEVAAYWNAQIQNCFAENAEANQLENVLEYLLVEYSWYLHGSMVGSEICVAEAARMVEESDGELLEPVVQQAAYGMRGLVAKSEAAITGSRKKGFFRNR